MKRRDFLINTGLSSAVLVTSRSLFQWLISGDTTSSLDFYVGTYGTGQNGGIYFCRLDLSTGEMILSGETRGIDNASFLTVDSNNRFLYAVNEVSEIKGLKGGSVSSFEIDPGNGDLKFINLQPVLGESPCYISLDHIGKYIMIANYTGGSILVLPVGDTGMIGEKVEFIRHTGHSINPERQEGPHPHSIIPSPDNHFVYVPDLGLDRILIYRFDQVTGKLIPNKTPFISTKPGAGPRHFTFHPNSKFAYVINELDSSITVYQYKQNSGRLKEIQTVATLPPDYTGENYCADIHVHPNGKYLYGSNRGHNSISCFNIDPSTGRLSMKGLTPSWGDWPRNFAIDPTGKYLLTANQRCNNIVSFMIDPDTGDLTPTNYMFEIPEPVCIRFLN